MTSLASRIARFRALPPNLRGMAWMVLGAVAFVAMVILVRYASARFSAVELLFWRALFGLMFLAPWLVGGGIRGIRSARPGLQVGRCVIHFFGGILWFFVISKINLALGMTLQFTVPLFTILGAMIFLGERTDGRRLAATLVGFAGVIIALRPGSGGIDTLALITLASAVLYGLSNVMTKVLSRTDPSNVVVFYMNLIHLPMSVVAMLIFGFTVPGWADLPWLIGVALAANLAHLCLVQAFRNGDAGAIMPLDFLKLPMISGGAYILLGQPTDPTTWIGGAVIFAATYYIVLRETRRGKRAKTS